MSFRNGGVKSMNFETWQRKAEYRKKKGLCHKCGKKHCKCK